MSVEETNDTPKSFEELDVYFDKLHYDLEKFNEEWGDNLTDDDDLVFYIRKDDWRNEVKHCTFAEWCDTDISQEAEIAMVEPNEWWKTNRVRRKMKEKKRTNVKVHYHKDSDTVWHLVPWERFDPTKMSVIEESDEEIQQQEFNIKDMIRTGRAPGMFLKTDDKRGDIFHRGKLDEGAMGDLIDKGLDGAMKRAEQREKKYGKGRAWQPKSFGRRIHNERKAKRH